MPGNTFSFFYIGARTQTQVLPSSIHEDESFRNRAFKDALKSRIQMTASWIGLVLYPAEHPRGEGRGRLI